MSPSHVNTKPLAQSSAFGSTPSLSPAHVAKSIMGSWGELLSPRLALAQERGVVRSDIPAERLTLVLTSFLDGYLIQRMADPAMDADATANTLIQLLSPPGKETT